jgi:general secretion pathway protein D
MLGGLIREEERRLWKTLPGLSNLPVLRELFGHQNGSAEQSDVVMIVTPHILMGHQIGIDDLKPLFAGTTNNVASGVPSLLSLDAPPPAPTVPLTGPVPAGATPPPGAAGTVPPPTPTPTPTTPPAGTTGAAPPRPIGVVPVTPVGGGAATPTPTPTPTPTSARFSVGVGTGDFSMSGGPYPVSIQATDVPQMSAVSLSITYNPAVVRAVAVNQGTLMQQGGVTPTFVPKIDNNAGRIDISISRPADVSGAAGTGMLAAIMFEPVAPGTAQVTVTGTAASTAGPIPVTNVPGTVTVKR